MTVKQAGDALARARELLSALHGHRALALKRGDTAAADRLEGNRLTHTIADLRRRLAVADRGADLDANLRATMEASVALYPALEAFCTALRDLQGSMRAIYPVTGDKS